MKKCSCMKVRIKNVYGDNNCEVFLRVYSFTDPYILFCKDVYSLLLKFLHETLLAL